MRRQLRITALGDLYISGRPEASHYRDTQYRIPGSQIRGIFASRWIREFGEPQAVSADLASDFVTLFHESVRWGSVFPVNGFTVPLSAMVHKSARPDDCRAPASQLDRALNAELGETRSCPSCGKSLDDGKGDDVPASLLRERTRVGLTASGSRREKAKDGMLFTRQALAQGTELSGWVYGSHPWIDRGIDEFDARLGGQRSVDGRVRIEIGPPAELPDWPAPDTGPVVLRANSAAVFVDQCGRPAVDPPLSELGFGADASIRHRWVRVTRVGGWDAVAGLPRAEDIAVAAGSTWVVDCDAVPSDLGDHLNRGVGLRRSVGYGDLTANPEPWSEPIGPGEDLQKPAQTVTLAFKDLKATIPNDSRTAKQIANHLRSAALAQSGRTGYVEEIGSGRTFDRFPEETKQKLSSVNVRQLSSDQKKQLADVIEAYSLEPGIFEAALVEES